MELWHVQIAWAPDSRTVALLPRDDGIIRLYLAREGTAVADVPVVSREEAQQEIVLVKWYTGEFGQQQFCVRSFVRGRVVEQVLFAGVDGVTSDAPCLAVCFANGLVQVFQHERDEGLFRAVCLLFLQPEVLNPYTIHT